MSNFISAIRYRMELHLPKTNKLGLGAPIENTKIQGRTLVSSRDKQNPNDHRPNHPSAITTSDYPRHWLQPTMFRDESACNSYNYGDSVYWDARYIHEAAAGSFDWYQRYHALRPFVRKYIPTSSRVLMVGCGNAVMSEDMVKDGYESIMNVDISCVAIEMMRRKYEHVPQLEYLQMDVRDMGFFLDDSFDSVIDKGTLDSLMCGTDAPISASQMLGEVSRILKPGGVYMLITYGDPTARMAHINRPAYNWKIDLYVIPRPGFQKPPGSTSSPKSHLSPVPTTEKGLLPADYVLEDPDSHFIYVCTKLVDNSNPGDSLTVNI